VIQLATRFDRIVRNSDTIPALKVECGRDVGRVRRETKLGRAPRVCGAYGHAYRQIGALLTNPLA